MTGTSETVEVLVVGAGGCGLMAALRAAADGAHVLVLEKTYAAGGGTTMATHNIRATGTRAQRDAGVEDDPELWVADIMSRNRGTGDAELTRSLARVSGEMADFLEEVTDVRFRLNPFNFGHSVQRLHAWPEDQPITDFMYRAVRRNPSIELRFNTQVTGLIQDEDGAVSGVRMGEHSVLAAKTILAAGGFNANYRMIREYIPQAADIPLIGHPGTDGEVMNLAVEAGAVLDNMDSFQPYPAYLMPSHRSVAPQVIFSGGIMVDLDGRRFINEMRYPGPLSTAMLDLPGKGAFEIFDQAIFDEHADSKAHDGVLRVLAAEGVLKCSDDIEGLASQLGVDATGLRVTIEEYAAACGSEDAFGREVARALVTPFYGIEVRVALYQTQGGVRVNGNAEVVDASGDPIPNLFAGGGMVSGISGPGSDGYMPGNGLITSLGLGYIAGREAARSIAS